MKYERIDRRTWDGTFWAGKMEKLVEMLQADVPFEGKVKDKKRPMLEEWRKLQNAYYRVYNDGDAFYSKLRHMATRFGMKSFYGSYEALEELADAVFEAAVIEMMEVKGGK